MQKRPSFDLPAIFVEAFSFDYGHGVSYEHKPERLNIFDVTYLHYHNTLELGFCEKGEGICYVDNKEYPFSAGDVQIVFPFQPHISKSNMNKPSEWYWLNIDCDKILNNGGFSDMQKIDKWLTTDMALCGIFKKKEYRNINRLVKSLIFSAWDKPEDNPYHYEIICSYLYTLVLELLIASADKPKLSLPRNPKLLSISPALEHINQSVASGTRVNAESLSSICAMSPTNFRRVFNATVGCSPKQYITDRFLKKAERMLVMTDESISVISEKCGFSDQSSFNRAFLNKNKKSPSAFKKEYSITGEKNDTRDHRH